MSNDTLSSSARRTVIPFASGLCNTETNGRFVSKQYEGEFAVEELQWKAGTRLWYTTATGFPVYVGLEGEGSTPAESLADLKARARDLAEKIALTFGPF